MPDTPVKRLKLPRVGSRRRRFLAKALQDELPSLLRIGRVSRSSALRRGIKVAWFRSRVGLMPRGSFHARRLGIGFSERRISSRAHTVRGTSSAQVGLLVIVIGTTEESQTLPFKHTWIGYCRMRKAPGKTFVGAKGGPSASRASGFEPQKRVGSAPSNPAPDLQRIGGPAHGRWTTAFDTASKTATVRYLGIRPTAGTRDLGLRRARRLQLRGWNRGWIL